MFSIGVEHEFSVHTLRISYLHSTFCGPAELHDDVSGRERLTDGQRRATGVKIEVCRRRTPALRPSRCAHGL